MNVGMCGDPADVTRLGLDVDYVEVNTLGFLVPDQDEEAFKAKWDVMNACETPTRRAVAFLPKDLPCVGDAVDKPAIMAFAETAFDRAQRVGIDVIVFGSGGSRTIPEGQTIEDIKPAFIELVRELGELAKKYDVKIAIEPLQAKECNFINSLADGAEIVQATDHPNVRLLADVFHMGAGGEDPKDIEKYGDLLIHMHIAQIEGRVYPGKDNEDVLPYLQAVANSRYDGTISIECRWNTLDTQGAEGLARLRELMSKAGI